jgi:hypothetical protein
MLRSKHMNLARSAEPDHPSVPLRNAFAFLAVLAVRACGADEGFMPMDAAATGNDSGGAGVDGGVVDAGDPIRGNPMPG